MERGTQFVIAAVIAAVLLYFMFGSEGSSSSGDLLGGCSMPWLGRKVMHR